MYIALNFMYVILYKCTTMLPSKAKTQWTTFVLQFVHFIKDSR